jgi:hypothetical protein
MNAFARLFAPLLPAAMLLAAPAAHAQLGQMQGVATGPVVTNPKAGDAYKPVPKPPALPGARTATATPARPEHVASDMQPTDALFDAINRGDISGARDAIGRGADLNGHNVLGLTPVDLAVDLGHNDITFLLLSLRGANPTSIAPAAVAARAPARPVAPARSVVKVAAVSKPAPPPVPAAAPRQYVSNDPGTPQPQAGFLGFGPKY